MPLRLGNMRRGEDEECSTEEDYDYSEPETVSQYHTRRPSRATRAAIQNKSQKCKDAKPEPLQFRV